MSKVLIKSSTLTDIANAIRTKDGSTAQMYPSEMAGKIQNIETKPGSATIIINNKDDGYQVLAVYKTNAHYIAKGSNVSIKFNVGESISLIFLTNTTYALSVFGYDSAYCDVFSSDRCAVITLKKESSSTLTINAEYRRN